MLPSYDLERDMFFEVEGDAFYASFEKPPGRPEVRKYEAPKVVRERAISFELTREEEPFARGLAAEIEAAYSGFASMPPELGRVVVPGVHELHDSREVTLFDCLFTAER